MRITQEELRERVIAAAVDQLAETGVVVGIDHLNMEELIRAVGVPRSSAFAAFGNKDELTTELMIALLHGPAIPVGYSVASITAANDVFARYKDSLSTPQGQDAVLREAIRVALRVNFTDALSSTPWRNFVALATASQGMQEPRRQRVLAAVAEAESRFVDAMTPTYVALLGAAGRRPVDGVTFRTIATAGSAVIEGLVSRTLAGSPEAASTVVLPGLDGAPVEWQLPELAFCGVIEALTVRM